MAHFAKIDDDDITVLNVEVIEDEREQYGGHTHRLDMENALVFDRNDFLSACKEMGITKDLKGSN